MTDDFPEAKPGQYHPDELCTDQVRALRTAILARHPELTSIADAPPTSILGNGPHRDIYADTDEEFVAQYGNVEEKALMERHFEAIRSYRRFHMRRRTSKS